jgi:hypothetical protein
MTGQNLVDRIGEWLRQWVVLTPEQALVLSLWALHTWVYDKFAATPYLEISATTKRSGKTTLLEALGMLSRNAKLLPMIRPLTIVRMIAHFEGKITVMIDEAEKLGNAALNETRTMFATGYRHGQMHAVSVGSKFQEFPTYCPKAFALIGNVQDVIRDRCIPIYLERGMPPLMLTNNRETALEQSEDLIAAWVEVAKGIPRLPIVEPSWLTSPRDRELWTPIFSLASALQLHKATVEMLQAASVDMSALKSLPSRKYHSAQEEQDAEDRGYAERVLADIRTVWPETEKAIASGVLVERLRAINTSPWRSLRGVGLNEITLAALLSRFGVQTKDTRIGKGRKDSKVLKAYKRDEVFAVKL